AAALGAWAYGTYEPNSPLFGRAVGRGPTRERVAYLTFDDGPNPGATEPILETLAASDVPAAFFLVGEHVRRFPKVARRVAAAGHEVGNHTLPFHRPSDDPPAGCGHWITQHPLTRLAGFARFAT